MTNDERVLYDLLETYPDGHIHQGAWFYLTRGDCHLAITRSDPPTMAGVRLWNVATFLVENGETAEKADFIVDVPASAVLPTVDEITPPIELRSCVQIPGVFRAFYEGGRILGFQFEPHGSNAGYFGPAAILEDGDAHLDIEDTDGPFWKAVQAYLADRSGDFEGTWAE